MIPGFAKPKKALDLFINFVLKNKAKQQQKPRLGFSANGADMRRKSAINHIDKLIILKNDL